MDNFFHIEGANRSVFFDESGQSQPFLGLYHPSPDGAVSPDPNTYTFWVRRARRYTFLAGKIGTDNDTLNEAERTEFAYWLVGSDGNILTSGLTRDGMLAAVAARIYMPVETEQEYNERTNHGAF